MTIPLVISIFTKEEVFNDYRVRIYTIYGGVLTYRERD